MAFHQIKNVQIEGITVCVPAKIEENSSLSIFETHEEYERFVSTTGIERRHIVSKGMCSSDLCFEAALSLLNDLNWDTDEIDCLIFVSQTPDYKLPATSCVLQGRLGLSKSCMAFDISLGCSGWVYGMTTISALLSSGSIKKGLLLVGDTVTITKSNLDKSTYPLFGDAGSATAITYSEGALGIKSCLFTDGNNYDAIIIEDGGARNPVTLASFEMINYENGIVRSKLHSILDGSSVFIFGISKAPQCVKDLIDHFEIDKEKIDYFIFHQANMLMNEKIRTKLKLPVEKVPYILKDYGNTSSTSIPLTMVCTLSKEIKNNKLDFLACGFGVGLSWGAISFETSHLKSCKLIEI
jgi:3-oxoacyl-[acyl-carrier-protein] synthase-3